MIVLGAFGSIKNLIIKNNKEIKTINKENKIDTIEMYKSISSFIKTNYLKLL